MLAIEVELLTGCYTATHFNDRNRPEWPPHPARLFSAMVNAWGDADEQNDTESQALRWLEAEGEPILSCSVQTDDPETNQVATRSATTHFVPVNDPAATRDLSSGYLRLVDAQRAASTARDGDDPKAAARAEKALAKAKTKARADSEKAASSGTAAASALKLLPDQRTKQARTYPTVRPASPTVALTWPEADPDRGTREALDTLLARVGRLGHSSTLVSCCVIDASPPASYVPSTSGTAVRLPGPGQFDRLCELHQSHQGQEPRQLPSRMARYRPAQDDTPAMARSNLDGDFLVASLVSGRRVSVRSSLSLARAARSALLHHAGADGATIPELISGHVPRQDGERSTGRSSNPHMAIVPLPFVGHEHCDGLVKGIAILCPSGAGSEDRHDLLRAAGRWLSVNEDAEHPSPNLRGAGLPEGLTFARDMSDRPMVTLRASRWRGPAQRWISVTPIVLDRYPKGLWRGSAAKRARAEDEAIDSIRTSCTHLDLPKPTRVEIRSDAPLVGIEPLRRYPQFRSGQAQTPRVSVHAIIDFDEPVVGPVILGRGRFLGQGLCSPIRGANSDA